MALASDTRWWDSNEVLMELQRGSIVRSKAGRDKGGFLAVLSFELDSCLLCDGKERPLERPKRKNVKHLAVTGIVLEEERLVNNARIRKALREFRDADSGEEIMCPNRI